MKIGLSLEGATLKTGKTSLPTGSYNFKISNCELVQTNKGHTALKLSYGVLDGDMKGRPFSEFFNINHPKDETVRIAKDDLFTVMTHAGAKNPRTLGDSSEIIGLKFRMILEEQDSEFMGKDGEMVKSKENKVIMRMPYEEGVESVVEGKDANNSPFHEPQTETKSKESTPVGEVDDELPWNN